MTREGDLDALRRVSEPAFSARLAHDVFPPVSAVALDTAETEEPSLVCCSGRQISSSF